MYLIDKYVATKPGEPFRLFPLGQVIKDGKAHDITEVMIRAFSLPHFKPAIKLGSHDDITPAGGHIIGLECREDGLYAIPEYNDDGLQALERGAYRYQSPEVIWADGWMEDPNTGDRIEGPLIVGTALLHMPHLGEAAALYKVEVHEGETMSETVAVPTSLWDTFAGWVKKNVEQGTPEPIAPVTPEPSPEPDAFAALQGERDDLAAKIASMEAVAERKVRLDKFAVELKTTGLADKEGVVAEGAPDMLATMTEDQSAWVMSQFKALSERIDKSALFKEAGKASSKQAGDPGSLFKAAIEDCMVDNRNMTYDEAMNDVAEKQPDLWNDYILTRGAK